MTFGTQLQGQTSHEALVHRQDTEIKLLENFRKGLNLRIRAEKDYANALMNIVNPAQKFDCPDSGSPVFKVRQ